MTLDRVRELRLNVRAGPEVGPAVRERAEQFTRRALERAAELVETRASGRRIFVRTLPTRWAMDESRLDDSVAVERCAADLADALAALPVTPNPALESQVVVFEDEAQWRAAHLAARAAGRPPPWIFGALEEEEEPIAALCRPERRTLARAVVTRLATGGRLRDVVASLSAPEVLTLTRALGLDFELARPPKPPQTATRNSPAVVATLAARARELYAIRSPQAVALFLWGEASGLLSPEAPEAELGAIVQSAFARLTSPLPDPAAAAAATPIDSQRPSATSTREPAERVVETRFSGLFYLLSLVLELDIGEALWKVCLPEGGVLAAVAAALLAEEGEGDPAPLLFGGVDTIRLPVVAAEQQTEVARAVLGALVAALPRWGLAVVPELHVSLIDRAPGRLLLGVPAGSPFVLFAAPVSRGRDAARALNDLVDAWPRSGPRLVATRGLAELAPERVVVADTHGVAPFLPSAPTTQAAALLTQLAGTLGHLFSARAGAAPATAAEFVRRYLVLPARVHAAPESLTVSMSTGSIDSAVRRGGLDKDPGWVGWLGREVRIEFVYHEGRALSQ